MVFLLFFFCTGHRGPQLHVKQSDNQIQQPAAFAAILSISMAPSRTPAPHSRTAMLYLLLFLTPSALHISIVKAPELAPEQGIRPAPAMAATRASSLLILLLIIQLNLLFHLPAGSSSVTAVAQAADEQQNTKQQHRQPALVQSTCNSTSFYDVCIAALAADPSSSTADVPGLCAIAVSAAAANASGTAAFLGNASSDAAAAAAGTPEAADYRALLRACAGKYAAARDALLEARASLAQQAYDYAFVHVSAAGEYPAVCRTLFRRRQQRGGSSRPYPPELAKREEALRRLCTIALDIISLLQNQEPN